LPQVASLFSTLFPFLGFGKPVFTPITVGFRLEATLRCLGTISFGTVHLLGRASCCHPVHQKAPVLEINKGKSLAKGSEIATTMSALPHCPRPFRSEILSQPAEKRVTYLAFGRLRPVLDLGEQLRLDPACPVSDPLAVGLCFANQRRKTLLQGGEGCFVKAMIDLAGIYQIGALRRPT
jgi:hypothetical protein